MCVVPFVRQYRFAFFVCFEDAIFVVRSGPKFTGKEGATQVLPSARGTDFVADTVAGIFHESTAA